MKRTNLWIIIIFVVIGIGLGLAAFRLSPQQPLRNNQIISRVVNSTPTVPPQNEQIVKPQSLVIPKLNVTTTVEEVGEDSEGKMDVPKGVYNVGWYNLGFKPGEKGAAVMAGHLDTVTGAPAVFYYLEQLQVGDQVIVTGGNNKQLIFEVTNVQNYPFDQVPLGQVFGPSEKPMLNLITCTGTWDTGARNYSNRLVVYTQLKSKSI